MKLVSCSTLHKEYLPKAYSSYITPLWCGFGKESEYYTSSLLSSYIDSIKQYRKDIIAYTPEHSLSNTLILDDTQQSESIEEIADAIQTGILSPTKYKKITEEIYKNLAIGYTLEEQERRIQEEYNIIERQYESILQYLPDLLVPKEESEYKYATLETIAPPTIEAILHYCKYDTEVILVSHSSVLDKYCISNNLYSDAPDNLNNVLIQHNLKQYYKGYINNITITLDNKDYTYANPTIILESITTEN